VRDRRVPGSEDVGAERQEVTRPREVERRQLRAAKTDVAGTPDDRLVEDLERDRRRRTKRAEELRDELIAVAPPRA
jgi:hypothetical protein